MLVLLKNNLNYLKGSILEWFLKNIIGFYLFFIFFITYNNGNFNLDVENIIKYIRNLFRLKRKQNYTAIKDIINLFRLKKKLKQLKIKYLEISKNFWAWIKRKLWQTSKRE